VRAIIPVAGHGTRLEPHTLTLQKCLLPVGGKPVLEHILDRITNAGITDVTLITGHLGEQVVEFCTSYPNANFTFIGFVIDLIFMRIIYYVYTFIKKLFNYHSNRQGV
jgi:NDP-sugar pyrophosphorylase family protein